MHPLNHNTRLWIPRAASMSKKMRAWFLRYCQQSINSFHRGWMAVTVVVIAATAVVAAAVVVAATAVVKSAAAAAAVAVKVARVTNRRHLSGP